MSRTLLLSRVVTLHRPRQVTPSLRPFSTSKPSEGDKEKQGRKKNAASPGPSKSLQRQTTASQTSKNNRSKSGKELPPILIPPGKQKSYVSLPNPPFDRSRSDNQETHGLWSVNVSPFLDPKDFCRRSAFYEEKPTLNGTLAARRLLEGKKLLLETLSEDILRIKNKQRKPRSYTILGHGVPKQLLQSHVNMADFLLAHYKNSPEISFKNSTGKLSVETLRIRSPHPDGKNRAEPWSFAQHSELDDQMQLYLAVMNRISTTLSDVLWSDAPMPAVENEEDDDDDFVRSSSSSAVTPLHWNVELMKGTDNPFDSMLTPIVEWTLPESGLAPGRMSIRLRGLSRSPAPVSNNRRRRKPVEVTLTYRASFQNPATCEKS